MIELVVKLLVVDIFLEFGRVTNLVYGQALKTSGDAIFPVIMGAIFMYLFAVGGTYFLLFYKTLSFPFSTFPSKHHSNCSRTLVTCHGNICPYRKHNNSE